MAHYNSNIELAQEISARIGSSPIPFESVHDICMEIYQDLGGDIEEFDDVYSILLEILPLAEQGGRGVIDDTVISTEKTWSSNKINSELSGHYTKTETDTLLSGKQDTLTAGNNIDITNNTIKAVGYRYNTTNGAFAEGDRNINDGGTIRKMPSATGVMAHAEGVNSSASARAAHAEGTNTVASGVDAHAEGSGSQATASHTHAEGQSTKASQNSAHAEGNATQAAAHYSHAEGDSTITSGSAAHAEGMNTSAEDNAAHAEGISSRLVAGKNYTIQIRKLTESEKTQLKTQYNIDVEYLSRENSTSDVPDGIFGGMIILGSQTVRMSFTRFVSIPVTGDAFATEIPLSGLSTTTFTDATLYYLPRYGTAKYCAHSEGFDTLAEGNFSHSEGETTAAVGYAAHAEGVLTAATGKGSHAEGRDNEAGGEYSHAEGLSTLAQGDHSHTEGEGTQTFNQDEHAEGRYNVSHSNGDPAATHANTIHSIGIGEDESSRRNAIEVMQNGDIYVYGIGYYDGTATKESDPQIMTLQDIVRAIQDNTGIDLGVII